MRVRKRAFGCRLAGHIAPCWTVLCTLLLLLGSFSFAGGPLRIFRPGEFMRWDTSQPIKIKIDQGPVKEIPNVRVIYDNATGVQIVQDMLQIWADVSTATVTFEDQEPLPADVDASNWGEFNQTLEQSHPDAISVVFDADGSIHQLIYGPSTTVLGFAIAGIEDRSDSFYDYGRLVLNGRSVDLSQGSKEFHWTTLHELGHTLGLDHSQTSTQDRPVMYPTSEGPTPNDPVLHLDDKVWFSYLHPTSDFATDYGTIRGKVTRRTTQPFQGANVVAAPATTISSGLILERGAGHISAVSDFLKEGNGNFELPGLPPGNYLVFIEPLDSAFTEGNGVGPFDSRFSDFSKDYYNGENESGDPDLDDVDDKVVIEVVAGGTVNSIDLVANETANQLETLTDDDAELFILPDGFSFPFFGKVYDSIAVNSDGNLTLTIGDSSSGPRDEGRFLHGPPRIAPLFTDLDPSATTNNVSFETKDGNLTFLWDNIPEFGEDSNLNTFSVTLFPNGDIRFHYDEIAITPANEEDDLIAIVGITPGWDAFGTPVDFSEQTQPLAIDAHPIYEVINGSFDLTGMEILFQAATNQVFVYFPAYRGGEGTFTGFAVTNYAAGPASLNFEALAASGDFQTYPDNPHGEILKSGYQLARLGSELFGLGFSTDQDGWVRLRSNTLDLAAFFLIGNGIDQLDGSVAFTQPSNRLYFTRLWDGVGSFPSLSGPLDAETFLGLANPNDETISLSLKLYAPDGTERGSAVSRQLPPLGYLWESLSSLFDAGVVADGYVAIDAADLGAIGFGLIEAGETLLGFNAASSNSDRALYSAQLAHGGASGFSFFTSIKLVNTDVSARSVRLTASDQEGLQIGQTTVRLDSGHSFQRSAGEMFSLGSADQEPVVVGSVQVEADGPGVVGDVVFGDPTAMRYAAALPLQSRLLTRAIFSHVANARGATPADNLFTGLAFYNPGQSEVEITIKVFSPDFVLTGDTKLTLGPNERVSEILHAMIPASLGQNGGYIEVTSTAPVVAQQLFGNEALDYLSAVPPNIIQ